MKKQIVTLDTINKDLRGKNKELEEELEIEREEFDNHIANQKNVTN